MGLLGNFVGNALGMQSAEEYTRAVEAADRLQKLQRANSAAQNQLNYGVDKTMQNGVANIQPFSPGGAFSFDNLQQPELRNIPPQPVPLPPTDANPTRVFTPLPPRPSTKPNTNPAAAATETVAPTIIVNGRKEPSISSPNVKPDITKFIKNPPNIGIETNNLLRQREFAVNALNRQLGIVNDQINRNNTRVAEYERMAQIARTSGDLPGYERYKTAADQLNANSNAIREKAIAAQNTARATILEFDNKLLLVQGAQALQDLSYGSTARAGAVLSAFSGTNIQVVPRSDGKFDIVVEGQRQATYTMAELSGKLQSTFNAAYRENQQKTQEYLFEKSTDLQIELAKQRGSKVRPLGDGLALVYDNGRYFLLQPETPKKTPTGETVMVPKLSPLSPASNSANDYKAALGRNR